MDHSPLETSRVDRPRILVVEPKKSNMAVIVRRLTESHYRVSTAEDAAGAIAELHRVDIDLVLSELDLPRTSGAELAGIVRSAVQWSDIPVMLITGRSNPKNAVRAYDAGADDVILKPFHFEVLVARIERRLARTRSIKRLRDDNAALDARIVERAIEMGELREKLHARERELLRIDRRSA